MAGSPFQAESPLMLLGLFGSPRFNVFALLGIVLGIIGTRSVLRRLALIGLALSVLSIVVSVLLVYVDAARQAAVVS